MFGCFAMRPNALFLFEFSSLVHAQAWAFLLGKWEIRQLEGDVKRTRLVLLLVFGMLAALLPLSAVPVAAAGFTENFDNDSRFVTNSGFFSDGSGDYFGITDGVTGDFGGGSVPSALKSYTGFTDSFLTGMDLDGDQTFLPVTADWTGIDITGIAVIEFSGDFAEYFDSPGDIDAADYLFVEYQIDGGGYQKLLQFSGADFSSGTFNGIFPRGYELRWRGRWHSPGELGADFRETDSRDRHSPRSSSYGVR